jgi:ADP-ribose pyrophosphatase
VHAGGGVEGENIIVHRVPLSGIAGFVAEQRALGKMIDVRVLLLLAGGILAASQ